MAQSDFRDVGFWHISHMPTRPPNICFQGKADNICSQRIFLVLTQSGQFSLVALQQISNGSSVVDLVEVSLLAIALINSSVRGGLWK
jgi:hypothetical protein